MKKLSCLFVAAAAVMFSSSLAVAGDAEVKGEKEFKRRCASCHYVLKDKKRVGPSLFKIINRQAGTSKGFRYGKDMVAAGEKGLKWTPENLVEFLEKPRVYLGKHVGKGKASSRMVLRLRDLEKRKDIVAYLVSLQPELKAEVKAESEEKAKPEGEKK
ncbi:MAG: c-type cytochrome [Methyloligellaceae bacterium]